MEPGLCSPQTSGGSTRARVTRGAILQENLESWRPGDAVGRRKVRTKVKTCFTHGRGMPRGILGVLMR